MGEIDQENRPLGAQMRAEATRLSLRDDLADWADNNKEFIARTIEALKDTYARLSEDDLWDAIVMANNPPDDWTVARARLREAKLDIDELRSPENTSLGLIDAALNSEADNNAEAAWAGAFANFFAVDSLLRNQRQDLGRLMQVLLVQRRMLQSSAQLSQTAANAADVCVKNSAKRAETDSKYAARDEAQKRRKTSGVGKAFKKVTDKFLSKKPAKKISGTVPAMTAPSLDKNF